MHEQERDNCILVLQDVPKGCEIGIDYHSWFTGENFQGISNVRPGFHFVFIRVVDDRYGDMAPRSGFYIHLTPGDVVIRRFQKDNEEFASVEEIVSVESMYFLLRSLNYVYNRGNSQK